jgi:hypothetical protein
LETFDSDWDDEKFKDRAKAFLRKFTDAHGKPVASPAVLGRMNQPVDGQLPTAQSAGRPDEKRPKSVGDPPLLPTVVLSP